MRTSCVIAAILVLLAGVSPAPAVQQTFCVSPSGSDANPGTESRPWATIQKARDAVRAVNRAMTGDVVVVLRGGTYTLRGTLVFEPRDGGTSGHSVRYVAQPGEAPVISGGRAITGWQADAGGRWKAPAPVDDFRQLYVGGVRATRARGGPPPGIKLSGDDGYTTDNAAMAGWRNPGDVEFCYRVVWCHTRCKVQGIGRDGERAVIAMLQPWFTLARTKEGVHVDLPSYVENALELLDEPGEWYLDRPAHVVYYMPRPGEDMKSALVTAPGVEKLVELRGTLEQPVSNLHFVGLTFAQAGWLRPNRIGHVDVQANFIADPQKPLKRSGVVAAVHNEYVKSQANIVCHAARAVRFERCTFTQLGGAAIDLESGSRDNVVAGCRFHDISGTAIQVGDVLKNDHHPDDPRLVVRNNTIANNTIHDVCVEYQGGVGIFVGYTEGTVVAHNEICRLPYSGVSAGWGWGEEDAGGGAYPEPFLYDTPTPAKNNRIEQNHIHHVMQSLQDGGGIYTLGNMPGSIIRTNHLHDNPGAPGGIYLDEGSGQIEVTGNVVYGVRTPMNFNNRAQNRIATCKVHENFFGTSPGEPGKMPEAAKKVVEAAGLEPAYRDLFK